jgi:hypothetical protein
MKQILQVAFMRTAMKLLQSIKKRSMLSGQSKANGRAKCPGEVTSAPGAARGHFFSVLQLVLEQCRSIKQLYNPFQQGSLFKRPAR